ncbi:MAG: ADP-ribosylglycohydrolase family protein [Oscillospiraceae bacterium]
MTCRQEKILGGLLCGAIGDSMGAATEIRTTEMIKERFGGYVKDLYAAPDDTYGKGNPLGSVTDDFSLSYYSCAACLNGGGKVTRENAVKGLEEWMNHPEYSKNAGPTTKDALAKLRGEKVYEAPLKCINNRATNGAPMKVGFVGLLNACDPDRAIDDAITLCSITHNNTIALSGACAIASAVAEAMKPGVSYIECVEAGIYGAEEGYKRAQKTAKPVAGASVAERIRFAVDIGMRHQGDFDAAMTEISELIGGGLPANEAVPAAFGYITAVKGDPMQVIYMAVNAGDDTDTVACMAGYVAGTLGGYGKLNPRYLQIIERVNGFDLRGMAMRIDELLPKEAE